jgi:hypothetical protein
MPWNNAPLRLYHGTLEAAANGIRATQRADLSRCYPHKDFDRGFYTTSIRDHAEAFANNRLKDKLGLGRNPGRAAVVEFEINRNDFGGLDSLCFVQPTQHWVDFVAHCRDPSTTGHKPPGTYYDVVCGPVARLDQRPFPRLEQICFHSVRALNRLQFITVHWGIPDFQ